MALYDKASLVLIPSGTKEGVVFSQKPTNGDGDFTFSRSTAATRVNADGLIEKETQNLLLQSNNFNTTWVNVGATLTSGQSGYDGTNDAWKFDKDASQFRAITQTPTHSGVVTFSIYAKEGTLRYLNFYHPSSTYVQIWFDLQAGAVGVQAGAYIENKIEDVGSGWYRCSVTYNASSGVGLLIYPSSADGAYTAVAGNIYIQSAQLEQGSYATSYIPTQGSAVTRIVDACSQTPPSGIIGQTEGTVFVDVDFKTLSGTNMFVSIRPDASNKIEVYRDINTIYGEFASSSSFNFIASSVTVGRYKIAVAYSSGSSAMYINGILISSNTTAFAFSSTLDDIYINSRGTSFIEQSSYNDVKLYDTRLSNAELATLTTI